MASSKKGVDASHDRPCPVCGKSDYCILFPDGGANCYRVASNNEHEDSRGALYWVHSAHEGAAFEIPAEQHTARLGLATDDQRDRVYSDLQNQLTLSPEHKEALQARGLSEVAIREHGFRSMHSSAVVRATIAQSIADRFPWWSMVPGFFDQKGKARIAASQGLCIFGRDLAGRRNGVKLRSDSDDGSRYVWLSSTKHNGPSAGAPPSFWPPITQKPAQGQVRLCEGQFKALVSAEFTGIPGIASGSGVGSMASPRILDWLEELKPETVLFAPDQDAHLERQVTAQVRNTLGRLMARAKVQGFALLVEVWQSDIPPQDRHKGIDDCLAAGFSTQRIGPEDYLRSLPLDSAPFGETGPTGENLRPGFEPLAEDFETLPSLPSEVLAALVPEAPIPLEETAKKPVAPVEALPDLLKEFVLAISEAYQVPASYPISLVLGALSTATLKRTVVDCGRGPVTAMNEWFLTSLESGSGKSSALHLVFAPVYHYERQLVERSKPAEGSTTNMVGVVSSDPTPEAAEQRLRANDGRFAVANPEAADLFAILGGKYTANGSGANIGLFLKAYSGDTHRSDRVLRGATYISEPRLTLTLALQPSAFDRICCEGEFRERGLMARFLMDAPDSLLGYRKIDPDPVPQSLRIKWNSLISSLLNIEPPRNEQDEIQPHPIPVGPQAIQALRKFRVWAEQQLRPDGFFECCREFGARAAEHVVKLAGLLHCAEHPCRPWETALSEKTMQAGIELFGYFAENARMASTSGTERKKNGRLLYLLERIRSKPEWKVSFKARDLFLLVKKSRGFETMEALSNDLNRLVEFGYLSEVPVTVRKGRPSVSYQVHSLENHPQNPQKSSEPYAVRVSIEGETTLKTDFDTLNNTLESQAAEVRAAGALF